MTEFEARLKQAKVEHVYTIIPGGTHSMFVWHPRNYHDDDDHDHFFSPRQPKDR